MNIRSCLYKIGGVALTCVALFSCDDYLDREPLSDLIPDVYLKEESQLASYAVNLYKDFLPSHGGWSYGTFENDGHTDIMAVKDYDKRYVPGNWRVEEKEGEWNFDKIRKTNYFLNRVLPDYQAGNITGSDENIRHYIGEIYFLRAYEYFYRMQKLGDFPIVREELPQDVSALTAASVRMPQNEVARFIVSDLDSAILLLKDVAPDGNKNRISKYCAYLLKSRVALYEGTWLKYFANTAFVPNGTEWPGKESHPDYQYPTGDVNAESRYFLQLAMDAAKVVADAFPLTQQNSGHKLQQSETDEPNPYFDMFGAEDMSKYGEVLLWRQYSKALGLTHNVVVSTNFGGQSHGITRGMVDGFLMKNGLPIYAAGAEYKEDELLSSVVENRDERLQLFLKVPGQHNIIKTNSVGDHAVPVEPAPRILEPSYEKNYPTGYAIRKGGNFDQIHCANNGAYTGCVVFRATEAYLNYIEASCELNEGGSIDGVAVGYWRSIRERAGVDPDYMKTVNATVLSEEEKNDWAVYSANSPVSSLLYNIRRERKCELMAEGFRMMDLCRWRALDQLITTPYHIEGFKIWGPMKDWYVDENGNSLLQTGGSEANVSPESRSSYFRPYEISTKSEVYEGYKWAMAHYLSPIAQKHFQLTGGASSTIYQNPYWSTQANTGPQK